MEGKTFVGSLKNLYLEEQSYVHELENEISRLDAAIQKIFQLMDEDGDVRLVAIQPAWWFTSSPTRLSIWHRDT